MNLQNETEAPPHRSPANMNMFATEETDDGKFSDDRFGLYVFMIAGSVTLAVILLLTIREFYLSKYNFDILPFAHRRRSTPAHLDSDREMAEELQRQLNEEEREAERMKKRAERREWYQSYMNPFTMTVERKDLFYAHEMDGGGEQVVDEEEANERFRTMSTGELTVEEGFASEDDIDLELGDSNSCDDDEPVLCGEDAEDAHLYLRLPVFRHHIQRSVDAHCAICVSGYEEGDRVVWSNLECHHAFHDDCIMPWLAKGKKRCPICRHWFVPGTRIEDQKKALAERLEQEDSSAETDVTCSGSSTSGSSEANTFNREFEVADASENNVADASDGGKANLDATADSSKSETTSDGLNLGKHASNATTVSLDWEPKPLASAVDVRQDTVEENSGSLDRV
mmetsp:Transcript_70555/g.106744  ORF Transcript_70555/g.106744 Transcript_70555/m.106744 type:complete len:397 (-) Transcript_70555:287-1477(-)|eukprot:CAMPEP_0117000914 /NCGR_PEP_ID=MMETSP0472-20121206/3094_1 /TAXON_ID=693140 ORGANISM="Tiarina fusus, Strain LIS" /NCGR_SAMPLE_ID=MMETSP0472 /ASSEMBLY_ACC=CAM_ASM_000603 /LENGTH=396 /DNA_ID=CAMNT_0004700759 /DNA_START=280 /DNA_END=1470 /DNA_ORIENTATION=-